MAFPDKNPSVYPIRPLHDDAAPKTASQLCAGDIVITSFRQTAAGDGDVAMHFVPAVNVAEGARFSVTRYARGAAPTTGLAAGSIVNLTTSAPLQRGVAYFIIGRAADLAIQDVDNNVYGASLAGQAWPAAASNDDTVMLYTQAGTFCGLHAVGFRGADGALPNYGGLAPEATVTLPTPTPGLKLYMATYIQPNPAFTDITYDVVAVVPAAGMRGSLSRALHMNGGAGFVDIGALAGVTALPQFTTQISPAMGSMVFTQYFLGSPAVGPTRWEVVTLEPMARGARFSFATSAINDFATMERGNAEFVEVTAPVDVAAGDSFRVSVDGAAVTLTYRSRSGAMEDWASNITRSTLSAATPAAAWRSVYAQTRAPQTLAPFIDTVASVCGALHTSAAGVDDEVPLTPVEYERLPVSARVQWTQRAAVLPNTQLRMTDTTRERLKDAPPQAGSTGVLII
uniref:Uncharacterized protein n=1 Tax=viral metagenome TaxID=1070528 RepID=A0A6C0ATG6_9ZZZZ